MFTNIIINYYYSIQKKQKSVTGFKIVRVDEERSEHGNIMRPLFLLYLPMSKNQGNGTSMLTSHE